MHIDLPLKKRDSKKQENENPENPPLQKPEKSLDVFSHFSVVSV